MARCLICGLSLDGPFAECPSCDGPGTPSGSDTEGWRHPAFLNVGDDGPDPDLEEEADDRKPESADRPDRDDADLSLVGDPVVADPVTKKRRGCPPGGWPKKPETPRVDRDTTTTKKKVFSNGETVVLGAGTVVKPTRIEESPVFQEMVKEWERLEEEISRMRERQHFLKELAARAAVQFKQDNQDVLRGGGRGSPAVS